MSVNKFDDSRSTISYYSYINNFRSGPRSMKKSSKSRNFSILDNNRATKKPKFLTSGAKKAFNLFR